MKKFQLVISVLFSVNTSFAQVNKYAVSAIPDHLKKNASSVIREEQISFDVKSAAKATYKVHKVVTVLKEAGKDELFFYDFTDQFNTLEEFDIEVFDGDGVSKNKYHKSDLLKQTAGEGLVPDGKVYYIRIPTLTYPVTLQMDYTEKYNGILNYPDYAVQVPDQAVENSSYTAKVPIEPDLRYKAKNIALSPTVTSDGKYKLYNWTVKELPAIEYEPGAVSRESRYPRILISPNKFELDGYPGDMSSWQQFGYWYGSLAKNAMDLSDERKLFFLQLVKDAKTDKEKAAVIYQYLQQNCRYVLIALGIGGFKPFAASFVDKKKYGDCKALSNYTQSCLAAVGIKSYQALVNAEYNKEPVDPEFPYNGFNHVIVCIPGEKDSIWLECTSTTNAFGVFGSFTENRNALLITEEGGKLVATPKSKSSDNIFRTVSIIDLEPDGSGKADITLQAEGEYQQTFLHYFINEKKDEQKKFLVETLGFLHPDEFALHFNNSNKNEVIAVHMEIEKVPDFIAGTKMFIAPRIHKLWEKVLPNASQRKQDYYFQCPFIKTDSSVFKLPEAFEVETLPRNKTLNFAYGSFKTIYRFDPKLNAVITTARLELYRHKIPVADYTATKRFFDDVLSETAEKIVIIKNR